MYKVRGVFFTEPGVRAVEDLGWIETNSSLNELREVDVVEELWMSYPPGSVSLRWTKKGRLLTGERV